MVKEDSDSERGNPLPPHGYSFQLAAKVLLYAPSHRQDNTYYSLCYKPVMEHWLEREIAQHCTMSKRSYHEATSHSLWEGRKEMFYLTMHSTHFIYGYMASDIWLRTILIVREETRCRHIGYSFRLAARVLLYALSHRQDSTYHGLCYTSHGALAGMRNISMGPPPWRIDPTTHCTMSERSYHGATSRSLPCGC